MQRLLILLVFLFSNVLGSVAIAQTSESKPLPAHRFVTQPDTDHFGADLQALFDTSLEACQRACATQGACVGFVYNLKSNACFPKSELSAPSTFVGALTVRKVPVDSDLAARAADRASRLPLRGGNDLSAARTLASDIGSRYPLSGRDLGVLVDGSQQFFAGNNATMAARWMGEAVALSDAPDLWVEYARFVRAIPTDRSSETRRNLAEAASAALNGYLRADAAPLQATALTEAALALEKLGRGRDMVSMLRLAQDIAPRQDIAALLDRAVAKYGFRVSDTRVEADSADPRICIVFSEELAQTGVTYGDYLKSDAKGLAAEASGQELCLTGLTHGQHLRVTLRRGLPAANGEALVKDVDLRHYIRDRSPSVRFPGRAYVLARSDVTALPVETVNVDMLDLKLSRVSDRNLLRSMQDDLFARPLNQWQSENFDATLAEVLWSGTAEVQQELNRDMTTRLPLNDVLADQPVGIYALSASIPGADPYDSPAAMQWFVLTDLGLSSMSGADGLHVQVQGLSDAKARAGVEVELISEANAVIARATSDVTGYARFAPGLTRGTGSAAPAMLLARAGEEDFAFLSLRDAGFDLSDRGVEGRPAPGPVDVFLTTDRGAYRAGETINVTALSRDPRAQAIEGLPLIAVLKRPDGVEYSRHISDGGSAGGHVFALPVGDSVPRGSWSVEIYTDPKADPLARQTVLVEDFLPERIDFEQEIRDVARLRPGGQMVVDVKARFLFGAPGAGLSVEGDVSLSPVRQLSDWPGYRFGRYDAETTRQTRYFSADDTDAQGRAVATGDLPDIEAAGLPLEARLRLRLADGSARPVERAQTVPVRPATPVIGLKAQFADDVVAEGTEAGFELVALGPDLSPMPMQVQWVMNRVETRYQWYQLYGDWQWEPITRRTRVASGEAMLGSEPVAITAPVDWGRYELVVERLDGEYVTAAQDFYAGWYVPASDAQTPDRLELSLDRESYAPGDTARLRIVPQTAGTALISVMGSELIHRQAVAVKAGENVIPLEVTSEWGSGAYVSASVVQPVASREGRTPTRALGIAHATVAQPGQELDVAITVPEITRPRQTIEATVKVAGADAGEEVWLTLAAVDVGILNLTGYQSPDPVGYFHGQRRLGMELRDIYGRLIDPGNGALGRVRSGGDAGLGGQFQSPPPTQDLMSVFHGAVKVDETGSLRLPITLPDFNGTVRLMAVAWTDRSVGQAEADMVVRDPVVLTASLPRFLAPGDQSRIRLDITHADGPAGEVGLAVDVRGAGVRLGAVPASVGLAEKGRVILEVPVTADAVGDPELRLSLTTPGGAVLEQMLRLPVRANDPEVSETRRFSLASGDSFLFNADVFEGLRPGSARAVMSAGPLAKFDVPGLLAQLDGYPYGCTEQVTSKALPLLYLSSVADAAGLGDRPKVDARINSAIRKVLTRQAANGAFGLWRAESGDLWLDAYASDFLSRARAKGYVVPDQAFARAMDNLRNRLNYAPDFDNGGEEIAYALLVLAREGAAAMGDLRYYADVKAEAFSTPMGAAQLGAALAAYGDQRRADKMFARAAQMIAGQGAEQPLWRVDYGTQLRDTAAVLALAVEAGSAAVNRDYLTARVADSDGLRSTQEAAWSLLAAQALVDAPEDSGLRVNGQPVAGAFVEVMAGGSPKELSVTAASGRSTDITLTRIGVPVVPPAARGYGFALTREYYTLEGAPVDLTEVDVGTRLVTVLRVLPQEDIGARLMVNDPLPAGLEIDNPNLLRSGDLRDLDWLSLWDADHAEFRSDRFLAAVTSRGTDPITLAYMVRAVSPGSFHHPAASVEDMYRPAYRANTAAGRLQVR
ncbi:alpha-2-macroglobulin-like protein [Ruegeria sp. TM1040]|uniref:alpha-2-macroglobulin family protein n=1 Tax=Ruegeria sp. (strain TM1040) TaxID=292414 RepID=UPI0000557B55|nr:alpha-2-macroglobulin family protein [Ruegeria sp. TM1040]ABF65505.1 alpha-2-macroglobulin-like protein [Ruegeria sp. TM1040]